VVQVLQPLVFALSALLSMLLPFWGPWARAALTNTSLGGTATTLILALDLHPGTVRLLLRKSRFLISLNIGTRLVYTLAAISYFPHPVHVINLVSSLVAVSSACFQDSSQVTNMRHSLYPVGERVWRHL
jgi:hypothetical protein